jgi:hypothetical protein
MASYAYTFTSGDTVTPTKLNNARTVSEIVNADIASAANIAGSKLEDGAITNAKVNASAAIAHTKLANITAGQVLLGNASNVPTATALSGDVMVSSSGVTAISSGVIVDADVNAAAAISLSKLATGALPTAITVASANLVDGTIVNADINAAAAIDLSKLATGALPSAITVASSNLVDGTIVNADINASASIADTKLATISAAGKVSNSATTATNANTANAIVARDASGNFSAGTITANLTGTASAIADGSVSTAKIVDGNVTNAKLASDIDASKLTTGTLPIARIADAAVTPAKLSQPLTLATAQATTSGTSIDFTGIPSWAKRVTVMFDKVSANGSSFFLVQLGDSGGFETSGYESFLTAAATTVGTDNTTAGFRAGGGNAARSYRGIIQVCLLSGNTWVASGTLNDWAANNAYVSGSKTLSDTLTQVRLTTVNGTDTFDAGSVNIMYEGYECCHGKRQNNGGTTTARKTSGKQSASICRPAMCGTLRSASCWLALCGGTRRSNALNPGKLTAGSSLWLLALLAQTLCGSACAWRRIRRPMWHGAAEGALSRESTIGRN